MQTKRRGEGGGGDADCRDQEGPCERCGRCHSDHKLWELYARVFPALALFAGVLMVLDWLGL